MSLQGFIKSKLIMIRRLNKKSVPIRKERRKRSKNEQRN